jgi:hypothetical protein
MSARILIFASAVALVACTSSNPLYICGDDCPAMYDLAGADFAGRDLSLPPGAHDLSLPPDPGQPDFSTVPPDLSKGGGDSTDLARQCNPPFNSCFGQGPPCGNGCCGRGEWCNGNKCQCGDGASCTGQDHCASGGIISFDSCGTTCCGGFNDPCPL